jgi:hypothetical protein
LAVEKEMQQARQEKTTKFTQARKANETSDTSLLLTVLFSVAPFLGGITAAFKTRRIRGIVLVLERNDHHGGSNLPGFPADGKGVRGPDWFLGFG